MGTQTYENGSNLFANKARWRLHVIIGHKVDLVLNVLNS